ncbi:MAG: hypothetical protein OER21_11845 [Gemmatimonadota bacterium]|nr:hypothetical protein [Gemmatimonadota bacterium]
MPSRSTVLAAAVALVAVPACNESPTALEPDPSPIRTVVVHRFDSGRNVLLNTDGSDAGAMTAATDGMVPVGASAASRLVVFLHGTALVLGSLDLSVRLDTLLARVPDQMSLVAFSHDEQFVAFVSYAPVEAVLVYDRANRRTDTLPYGPIIPVLPPAFSPDDARIAVFSLNDLSLVLTELFPADAARRVTNVLPISHLVNRPIFGWPRWTAGGVALAVVRLATEGADTLLVGSIDPDNLGGGFDEEYRAVMAPVSDARPPVEIGVNSSYALTADGRALILAAEPGTGFGRHAVYLVTPNVARVQLLLDDPAQYPTLPQFVRE